MKFVCIKKPHKCGTEMFKEKYNLQNAQNHVSVQHWWVLIACKYLHLVTMFQESAKKMKMQEVIRDKTRFKRKDWNNWSCLAWRKKWEEVREWCHNSPQIHNFFCKSKRTSLFSVPKINLTRSYRPKHKRDSA